MESQPKTVKTGSLLLDDRNTRLPVDSRSLDQRALLHELVAHEEVRGLAASITKLGLFPNERLVVMPEGRRYLVLEGNRRLAAIRLLLSPELAETDAQVKYFRKMSSRANLLELAKVDVAVVPDRITAAPIIAALHTRESKKRWSTLQQARFYRELVDEGQTPAEVAEDLGLTLGQVQSYLRTERLYNVALTFDYSDDVRRKLDSRRFPLTTLERFLESRVGQKLLGIKLDDVHGFRGVVHSDRFQAVLKEVVTDVATKKGLTRKINDEPGFKKYAEQIEERLPKTKKRGSFLPGEFDGAGPESTPEPEKPKKPKKRRPKQSKSVIPTGFSCTCSHDRVRAIFGELKAMSIQQQRNSTGVMLRVLLDIALWSFLKAEGQADAACDFADPKKRKRKYNPEWTPPLRDLISFAVDTRVFPGMTADGYKSVRSLASRDAKYIITIDSFNQFTHNPFVTPTEGDLRSLWQRAEPMLEVILT